MRGVGLRHGSGHRDRTLHRVVRETRAAGDVRRREGDQDGGTHRQPGESICSFLTSHAPPPSTLPPGETSNYARSFQLNPLRLWVRGKVLTEYQPEIALRRRVFQGIDT